MLLLFLLQVYEKAKAFTAVGAGITLAPNGLSVIDSLGLYDKVRNIYTRMAPDSLPSRLC